MQFVHANFLCRMQTAILAEETVAIAHRSVMRCLLNFFKNVQVFSEALMMKTIFFDDEQHRKK